MQQLYVRRGEGKKDTKLMNIVIIVAKGEEQTPSFRMGNPKITITMSPPVSIRAGKPWVRFERHGKISCIDIKKKRSF